MDIKAIHSDQSLLEAHHKGDKEALGILYKKYLHLIYGVAMKYLKNRDDAQDTVMEVFEKLLYKPPEPPIRNYKTWLFVVTKNHCLMKLRKRQTRHVSLEEKNNFVEIVEETHPIDEEENLLALEGCIEQLNEEQKLCVTMFYIHQKCYKEIARETNYELKKVKSYLQNGKRNLKLCLEKKEAESK